MRIIIVAACEKLIFVFFSVFICAKDQALFEIRRPLCVIVCYCIVLLLSQCNKIEMLVQTQAHGEEDETIAADINKRCTYRKQKRIQYSKHY